MTNASRVNPMGYISVYFVNFSESQLWVIYKLYKLYQFEVSSNKFWFTLSMFDGGNFVQFQPINVKFSDKKFCWHFRGKFAKAKDNLHS
jgi:hypothetical protein